MDLEVKRKWFTKSSTIGELWIDGVFFCYTLEDRVRAPGVKVPKETAIPYGSYKLVIDWSERFQRLSPHVLDVPMFTGIRIHSGNTNVDTEGCLLVGLNRGQDIVTDSRKAFARLFPLLAAVDSQHETMTIRYTSQPPNFVPIV